MNTNHKHLQLSRRDFLKLTGTTGAGLVLAVFLDACAPASATPEIAIVTPTDTTPTHRPPFDWTPNIYLNLDNNGNLTVTAFRSEMGQGIRTALAMLVADELDVDWNSVRIVQAPADSKYGDQVTGGSRSIRSYYDGMRKAGAVARQMLVEAAAQAWGVEADACQTEAGYVIHPDSNQKIAYADLVESAADLKVPRDVQIKDKSQLNIIGTGLGHWDAPDIVTGKAIYGFDVRLPDMLFAVIARCPVIDGKFDSYDEAGALAVPGVRQIVELPKSIAVVAENSWAAIQGRNALNVSWEEGRNANLNTDEIRLEAAKSLPEPGSAGENSIDALYEMPYQAHATMETMNCTVHVHDGICEVWAPTQNPQLVQGMITAATRTQQDKVTVHVPLIGGGFGRRLEADYAFEAGQVAQAFQTPVQVFWTREDDFQHDYYHEMSVHYANGSLSEVRMPAIGTVGGSGVPTGAWRSVHNFTEAYPTQCFIDELAIATQRDSLDLRLELYDNRAAAVIKLAAEKAGWGNSLPAGWGRGVAYHSTFATHVAHVAEVSVDDNGNVRVQRVVCAVDCGAVVNPDNIAAQMEGGIVFGLTAALKAGITIENGRVQQSNFHDYPLLQMSEMPVVQVHIIESDNPPTGIGEMGVPPIAPAVANAVFAATGIRVRHIPIRPEDLKT